MPTYVVVLSPVVLYQEAWRALLSQQPDVAGVVTITAPSQLSDVHKLDRPATLLVDSPSLQLDVVRQVRSIASDIGLLFLVQTYDLNDIMLLLQAGANGCISRDDSVADLVRAVTAAGRGEIALPPTIAARALTALARGEPVGSGPTEMLSEREIDVIRLLGQGLTNKDIAQTLILSVRTVEAHLRSIYGKLDVRSRTEAALWAVRHGYGPVE